MVCVPAAGVLFAGDLVFRGRIPFVGQADSGRWIGALDRCWRWTPKIVVPGHGPPSTDPRADLELTRDYLVYLRETMGEAARNMEPFEEAYARTDWRASAACRCSGGQPHERLQHLPADGAARRNDASVAPLWRRREWPLALRPGARRRGGGAGGAGRAALAARSRCWTAHAGSGRPTAPPGAGVLRTSCPFCRRHNAHLEQLVAWQPRPAAAGAQGRGRPGSGGRARLPGRQGWSFAVTLDADRMRRGADDAAHDADDRAWSTAAAGSSR